MAEKPGSNLSDSPSDDQDDLHDVGRDVESDAQDAPPASAKPKEQPPAGESKEAAKPDDPVAKLLNSVRDGTFKPTAEADSSTPAPADKEPEKVSDDKPPKQDASIEKPTGKEPEKDPLADWSPTEKEHTKGKVKERFRTLSKIHDAEVQARQKLEKELEEVKSDATYGKAFRDIGEKFQVRQDMDALSDEQLAWSVRAQASAVRCVQAIAAGKQPTADDLQDMDDLRQGLELVDKQLGRSKPQMDVKSILAMIDEAEASLDPAAFAELRKVIGAPPVNEQPQAKPPAQPAPQRQAPPAGNPEIDAQRVRSVSAIVQSGIPEDQVDAHYKAKLQPIVAQSLAQRFPRISPDAAWQRTTPAERHALILEAIVTEQRGRTTNPPAPRRVPPSTPFRSQGRAPAPRAATSGDPVRDAIDRVRNGTAGTGQ